MLALLSTITFSSVLLYLSLNLFPKNTILEALFFLAGLILPLFIYKKSIKLALPQKRTLFKAGILITFLFVLAYVLSPLAFPQKVGDTEFLRFPGQGYK